MNINLISPTTNGNNFVVRFKEDIIIPERSKVYLNFASLSRENDIEFFEDQELTFHISQGDVRPSLIEDTNVDTLNHFFENADEKISVPAGSYNYQQLFNLITKNINLQINEPNDSDCKLYRAIAIADIDQTDAQIQRGEVDFSLGLIRDTSSLGSAQYTPFSINTSHSVNCGIDANGDLGSYIKTSADEVVRSGGGNQGFGATASNSFKNFVPGTFDKTPGTYTAIAMIGGSGTGLKLNANVLATGPIAATHLFGQGTSDKTLGTYTDVLATGGTGSGAKFTFNVVAGFPITMSGATQGTPDKNDGGFSEILLTGGTGTGLKVNFTVVAGAVNFATLTLFDEGEGGYTAGDVLTIPNNQGIGGTANTTITINTVGNNVQFSTVVLSDAGTGYTEDDELTLPCGGTADTTIDVNTVQLQVDTSSIAINAIGDGYAVNDTLTFPSASIGGTQDSTIQINKLNGGAGKAVFDNYAISNEKYFHAGYDDDTIVEKLNIIKCTTLNTIEDMMAEAGCVQVGLYSTNVAFGINDSEGNYTANSASRTKDIYKTQGNATLNSNGSNRIPKQFPPTDFGSNVKNMGMFFNVSVDCRGTNATAPKLKVFGAMKSSGNPNNYLGRGVHTWTSQNQSITTMKSLLGQNSRGLEILNIPGVSQGNQLSIGIQTYYEMDDLNSKKLYFRLINLQNIDYKKGLNEQKANILYDSKADNMVPSFFTDAFSLATDNTVINYATPATNGAYGVNIHTQGTPDKATGHIRHQAITTSNSAQGTGLILDYDIIGGAIDFKTIKVINSGTQYAVADEITFPAHGGTADTVGTISYLGNASRFNKIKSQYPFNVMVGATKQNDGWESIQIPSIPEQTPNAPRKPVGLLYKYEISATDELSRYLNIHTAEDRAQGFQRVLFPNTSDAMNPNIIHLDGMNLDWRNESYSVYLKELPIKNYKNNDRINNGGFAKNILANLPVPFSDGQTFKTQTKSMITATYKPNYQIISNLYNQETTVNKFSCEIRKLRTDRPATEIQRSVINFTIVPPDDYKGNLNSATNLL